MSGLQVVLIDDDRHVQDVACMCLEVYGGFRVHTAASGRVGLGLVREVQPDVVLLDVMMPDMDVADTVCQLLADPRTRDIPIVLFTARRCSHEVGELAGIGVRGIISKPFDPHTLAAEVTRMLDPAA